MPDSYPFPTYSGLLEPKHYKRIGSAIWLFLWCISSTTKEVERDGVVWGIVLGNKPLKLKELAETFGVNEKTVRRWLDVLEESEYIRVTRVAYGLIISVKNSKKFQNKTDKNVQSDEREWTKMSNPERTDMSTLSDKNDHSNKDITVDITNNIYAAAINTREEKTTGGVPTTESVQLADADQSKGQIPGNFSIDAYERIKEAYMRLAAIRGFDINVKDRTSILELLKYDIDTDKVIQWLEECFRDYKPKHKFDKINSFAYCLPKILDKHVSEQEGRKGGQNHRGNPRKPKNEVESIIGNRVGRIRRKTI